MMAESLKSFEYVIKLSMHLTIPNSFQMLYISLIVLRLNKKQLR